MDAIAGFRDAVPALNHRFGCWRGCLVGSSANYLLPSGGPQGNLPRPRTKP